MGLEEGKGGDSRSQGQVFRATDKRSRTPSSPAWKPAAPGTRLQGRGLAAMLSHLERDRGSAATPAPGRCQIPGPQPCSRAHWRPLAARSLWNLNSHHAPQNLASPQFLRQREMPLGQIWLISRAHPGQGQNASLLPLCCLQGDLRPHPGHGPPTLQTPECCPSSRGQRPSSLPEQPSGVPHSPTLQATPSRPRLAYRLLEALLASSPCAVSSLGRGLPLSRAQLQS